LIVGAEVMLAAWDNDWLFIHQHAHINVIKGLIVSKLQLIAKLLLLLLKSKLRLLLLLRESKLRLIAKLSSRAKLCSTKLVIGKW